MHTLPWIILSTVLALAVLLVTLWALRPRKLSGPAPLPTEWALSARPVFNTDERRVYRLLREALPHHVILSKLPMVRFCQPNDPNEVRFWYELLGTIHVAFAVCSANGRVLAAIDLDSDRAGSRRALQIKQSVLGACRVRYLRCAADRLPTMAELQLLVPQHGAAARGPQAAPSPNFHQARNSLSHAVASRRAERTALWQDSAFFQDSFFAPDSRMDGSSEFGALGPGSSRSGALPDDPGSGLRELGGVVVDSRRPPTRH